MYLEKILGKIVFFCHLVHCFDVFSVFWAFEGFRSSPSSSVLLFVNVHKIVRINDFSELESFIDCSLLQLTSGHLPAWYVSGV